MKTCKQVLFFGILICLCLAAGPSFAAEDAFQWLNPAYEDVSGEKSPHPDRRLKKNEISSECASYDEIKTAIRENLQKRVNSFALHVTETNFDDVDDMLERAFDEIGNEDDYLYWNIRRYSMNWDGWDGDIDVECTGEYLSSYDEEQQVSQKVALVLSEITGPDMSDEEKSRAIHDWIVRNVAYDLTDTERSAYSALYLGTSVCHGYALLTYKMLEQAGMETRIIAGSEEMNHVWNMLNLCGNWYHMDVTWDDPVPDNPNRVYYDYFQKSDEEMRNAPEPHTWEAGKYPESPAAYENGVCENIVVHGNVSDEKGNPIKKARVKAKCGERGIKQIVKTDASGYYEFTGLQSGNWMIKAIRKNYRKGKVYLDVSESGGYEQNFVLKKKQ